MKRLLLVLLLVALAGCFPYPARIVMPLRTRVVDAGTGQPISGAKVLRVMCDIHDFTCANAIVDRGETNQEGQIDLPGKRRWQLFIPFPGGMPVPNHQIAIWKPGYVAFVFSQYGDVDHLIRKSCERQDLLAALHEIPAERRVYTPRDQPEQLLLDGRVALERAAGEN
jgi:hypothetical protein